MSESTPIRVAQMMTDMNYGGVEMVVMNYYRHIDRSKVHLCASKATIKSRRLSRLLSCQNIIASI